jgi:hypothetical protein
MNIDQLEIIDGEALAEAIPNLDGFLLPKQVERAELELACVIVALQRLINYCRDKHSAMECRLEGNLDRAGHFEAMADANYKTLPDWAKW